MIAAVSALFLVGEIILFLQDLHVRASPDKIDDPFNILNELTDDPNTRNILDLLFQMLERDVLHLHLFQNTGNCLHPPGDTLNRRINIVFSELIPQADELDNDLAHRLFIGMKNFSPQLDFHFEAGLLT